MDTKQKILVILGIILFATIAFFAPRNSHAEPLKMRWTNSSGETFNKEFDLTDMNQRVEFRAIFGEKSKSIKACFGKADYAVKLLKERDEGTTEEEHLTTVRANYDRTKSESKGVVPWYVYVDFQRMVRDVHRRQGSGTVREYRYTDHNIVWDREFQWCANVRV